GIPCDRFCFEGFLPPKKGRKTYLAKLAGETRTMVFYESPHRLLRTLTDFAGVFGHDRQASVAREISKIHEEHARGTLGELIDLYAERTVKGEITIVVSGLAV
ncbi:MAG: 16S rRNA (cytidine(1402)-2'-O)-methyltransferase, partial [Bacteroidota bacterium]